MGEEAVAAGRWWCHVGEEAVAAGRWWCHMGEEAVAAEVLEVVGILGGPGSYKDTDNRVAGRNSATANSDQ